MNPAAMHSVTPQISFPLSPLAKSLQNAKSVAILVARCYRSLSGSTR